MKISILIPVYNESKTIFDVLSLVNGLEIEKEIIIVDDSSTDGTRELLRDNFGEENGNIRVFYHNTNKGKGAAIRTALSNANGEFIIVQDADMEYSPQDIKKLLKKAESSGKDAVYGSRFLSTWKITSLPHYAVNKFLTILTNVLFGGKLTDMETCYKLIRTDVIRELGLKSEKFDFEPEVTAKLLMKGVDIVEVPVSYRGRGYDEGKKIGWKDGVDAMFKIISLRIGKR